MREPGRRAARLTPQNKSQEADDGKASDRGPGGLPDLVGGTRSDGADHIHELDEHLELEHDQHLDATPSTTSTTFPNVCAGRTCTDRPPPAFLAGATGEVALEEGSYCWKSPIPNTEGHVMGLCGDTLAKVPDPILVVRAGETLTLRFGGAMTPTEVVLRRGEQSTSLPAGNPVRFVTNLPAGVHEVYFSTRWHQGDAVYLVRLDVRSAPRPLALTG